MNAYYYRFFKKLASIGYSVGIISLIIGVLLSVINQPVYASSQNMTGAGEQSSTHTPEPTQPPAECQPTHPPRPTHTQSVTEVPPTDVPPTDNPPTEVPPTGTQVLTEIAPTETQVPTEVVLTETLEATIELSSTPEETLTPVITETPTEATATQTVTEVPFKRLDVSYDCMDGQQLWKISNPNSTWVFTWWSFSDGSAYGGATIPGNDSVSFYVPSGYRTITVTWDERPLIRSLRVTTNPDRPCSITTTGTPTDSPTETATATEIPSATPTATETAIPTATEVAFQRLNVGYDCVNGQQMWTITNPNAFPVFAWWSFSDGSAPGGATIPGNSSVNFYVAGGYRTITVTWDEGVRIQSLSLTTDPDRACTINMTSTPASTSTPDLKIRKTPLTKTEPVFPTDPTATLLPTFISTLEASVNLEEPGLIPVTGADFSNPITNIPFNSLFLNLGFVFLGLAFLAHGVSYKLK